MKASSRSDRSIGSEWYQEIRKKTSAKMSSKSELMERSEANKPMNLTNVHTVQVLNEAST